MTMIALMGAGGKMGFRLSTNLQDSEFQVRHVEVSEAGRARLKDGLGIDCMTAEEAVPGADAVILADPGLMAYARDDQTRARVIHATARAVVTLIQRLAVFLPHRDGGQRFTASALWYEAFRRTYGAELRTESAETVKSVYEADPARYDDAAAKALAVLHEEGWLEAVHRHGDTFAVTMPAGRLRRARWTWRLRRPLAKLIAVVRLLKTAFTFGDWVPYAQFKIERHTGMKVELTPRQRRHPIIFFSPVILRLLLRGDLR